MAGYYDEITGEYVDTGSEGVTQGELDNTSGTGTVNDYTTQTFEDGSTLLLDASGNIIRSTSATDPSTASVDSSIGGTIKRFIDRAGTGAYNALKGAFTKTVNGQQVTDWKAVAGAAGGLYGLYQSQQNQQQPVGYQGKVPKYTAVREAVSGTYDPTRRAGSGGQRYFTKTAYAAPGDATAAAQTAATTQATGLAALNRANPAQQRFTPAATTGTNTTTGTTTPAATTTSAAPADASKVAELMPVPTYAMGGLTSLAKGGAPRYLNGATDGMADKIPARIDGDQEARLSHGEFVIPADVVGHLGNGNSEAGAQRLYSMMDKIRKARTGTTKQGKQINPDKFLA
jgi:hypothetical protein